MSPLGMISSMPDGGPPLANGITTNLKGVGVGFSKLFVVISLYLPNQSISMCNQREPMAHSDDLRGVYGGKEAWSAKDKHEKWRYTMVDLGLPLGI
jgi:hypothetical protein